MMTCRRYAVTNTEWLTGNSGSDQCSKLSGFTGWNRATTTKTWFPVESYEKLYLFLSYFHNTVFILWSALLIWLMAFNREHHLRQKSFQWKIKAGGRLIFKTNVWPDSVWQLQWIWWLWMSQDQTDEANGVFILGITAHKVLELWLCMQALGFNFWSM